MMNASVADNTIKINVAITLATSMQIFLKLLLVYAAAAPVASL